MAALNAWPQRHHRLGAARAVSQGAVPLPPLVWVQASNGFCTQIGNDIFAWFGTTKSKSRLNFLGLLRAGYTDYVVNDAALNYMRDRALAGPIIARLAEHPDKQFADRRAWQAHLERLGITELNVTPNPVQIATEGALWGSIQSHDFLRDTVIVSDDAGQCRARLRPPDRRTPSTRCVAAGRFGSGVCHAL